MNGKISQYLIGGLLTLLTLSCSERKNENPFYVKAYNLTDSLERIDYLTFITDNQIDTSDNYSNIKFQELHDTVSRVRRFFEDDDYLVLGTSMGEFGGSIIFSDKKSNLFYTLSCIAPLMVDKQNGYYYVTDQHCDYSFARTRILKIKDPKSLIKLNSNELPRGLRQRDSIWRANSEFIKNLNREIMLLDTANVSASIFYPHNGRDFLIYSAKNEYEVKFDETDTTFLGEIKNGSLITLDTILNEPTWTAKFEPSRIVNGIYSYKYGVESWNGLGIKDIDFKGRIFIKGDTIIIGHNNKDLREWKMKLRAGS